MVKIALIGCGSWGKNYVSVVERIPGLQLKYIYDKATPSINIPEHIIFTQDIEEILNDEEIRGVIIAIPAKYIFEITKKFLEAGKNVLTEKPMADSSEKALELVNLARGKNLILMVAHLFVYHPAIQKLKELIEIGELGKILHMYSIRAAPGPIRDASEVNALWDLAPFDISIFLYLIGREPDEIKAFSSDFLKRGIIDSASFSLNFKDVSAEAHVRWLDAEKIRKLTVIGDKKIAVFDDYSDEKLKVYNKRVEFGGNARIVDEGMFVPEIEDAQPLELQCKHFLECIRDGKKPITPGEDGYNVIKILENINKMFSDNIEKIKSENIELVDLSRVHKDIREEIIGEIKKVIDKNRYILGEELEEFERKFAEFHNIKYGIGVDNGTSALELSLRALGIGSGDEVIVPANTFIATASAVAFTGAMPVLVDCDEFFNIDINKIEEKVNNKTKAIIPVHLYGNPADMDEVIEIARKHNLKIIEDACQAHGALYKGKKVGNFSNLSCFSFYPSKNLGALGDGGMILTDNQELAEKLKMMRNYGQSKRYYHDFLGYNRRLDNLQAAVLNVKLKKLKEWNEERREIALMYKEKLKGLVILPGEKLDRDSVYHMFVIRVNDRDKLQEFLKSNGINTGISYPIPIHLQKSCSWMGHKAGDFPNAERFASEILSLPIFPGMTEKEIDYVAGKIKEFYS